jgi:O-antigen ligase
VAGLVTAALITPLAGAVALMILAPLRTLIATEAALALPLDIGQIALLVTLAAWLLRDLATRRRWPRLTWTPFLIPMLLFIAVVSLTAFSAHSMRLWLNEWLKWIQVLLLLLFVRAAGHGAWRWLLAGLIASGAANALIGVYQFFGGSGALHLLIDDRFFRAFGTFGQPNPFGGFMGLLAPLAAAAALGGAYSFYRSRARRDLLLAGFYAAATALLLVGLLMSWSRGAWLGFAAAAGVVIVLLPRRAWMGGLLLLAGASLLASLWAANLLPVTVTSRITSATAELFAFDDVRGVDITTANYAVVERLSHWQAALNMARAHPWLGVGMGNYEYAYPTYRLINWPEPLGHAHNYYLNMLAEGGLIGLIGYGKAWLLIVFLTWRAARHPDIPTRLIAVGLLGSWTYLLVHSIFDNLYVNNLFLHIGIMLGIAAVLYDDAQRYVTLRLL